MKNDLKLSILRRFIVTRAEPDGTNPAGISLSALDAALPDDDYFEVRSVLMEMVEDPDIPVEEVGGGRYRLTDLVEGMRYARGLRPLLYWGVD